MITPKAAWEAYLQHSVPDETPPLQRGELHRAFIAGMVIATHMRNEALQVHDPELFVALIGDIDAQIIEESNEAFPDRSERN